MTKVQSVCTFYLFTCHSADSLALARFFSMHGRTRHIGLWLVIALHLGSFEWGPALHKWQCSLASSGVSASSDCGSCSGGSLCGPPQAVVEVAEPSSSDSPEPAPEPHDPRHCSICIVYAHASALPVFALPVVAADTVQPIGSRYLPQVLRSQISGYLARGPPIGS